MRLLVSIIDHKEVKKCIRGGVDIIDIKNPREGSLGGHPPQTVSRIQRMIPDRFEVSATIGDVPNKPGLVAQAALGLATCRLDYIKLGLCDSFTPEEAIYLVRQIKGALKEIKAKSKIVICGYADAAHRNIVSYRDLPFIAYHGGADVAMIDTFEKVGGKGLFDYLSLSDLAKFCKESKKYRLSTALAGRLKKDDIRKIKNENICDFVGVRTLVCRQNDRNQEIDIDRIKDIKMILAG